MMNLSRPHIGSRAATVVFAVALMTFLGINSACAHARLVKSNPADKAKLTEAPQQLELWFNELLDDGFNYIEVYPESELKSKKRMNLATGDVKVDAKDRAHVTVALQALKPGNYVVDYRVLSRDGHSAPGRITFRVLEPKPAESAK